MDYNQLEYQQNNGLLHREDERQMGMFLHLSVLANAIFPFAGYIIPFVIWNSKKDTMPALTVHGKEILNWVLSSFIYSIICTIGLVVGILTAFVGEIFIIGIPIMVISGLILFVVSIANIAYAIIAGMKASKGEHWNYPFSLNLIK